MKVTDLKKGDIYLNRTSSLDGKGVAYPLRYVDDVFDSGSEIYVYWFPAKDGKPYGTQHISKFKPTDEVELSESKESEVPVSDLTDPENVTSSWKRLLKVSLPKLRTK